MKTKVVPMSEKVRSNSCYSYTICCRHLLIAHLPRGVSEFVCSRVRIKVRVGVNVRIRTNRVRARAKARVRGLGLVVG